MQTVVIVVAMVAGIAPLIMMLCLNQGEVK
jgi:hypothetical protein